MGMLRDGCRHEAAVLGLKFHKGDTPKYGHEQNNTAPDVAKYRTP
jgi:hypothetical protein